MSILFPDKPKKKSEGLFDKPLPGIFDETDRFGLAGFKIEGTGLFGQEKTTSKKAKSKKSKKKTSEKKSFSLFSSPESISARTSAEKAKSKAAELRARAELRKLEARERKLEAESRAESIRRAKRAGAKAVAGAKSIASRLRGNSLQAKRNKDGSIYD